MAYSTNWQTHLEEAARRGADPLQSWDVAASLGGNTLSGADAGLVGKYWAITGGSRNEEWISSDPSEFWYRQLRDAQNFFQQGMQHYGNLRSDILMKEAREKDAELNAWKNELDAKIQGSTGEMRAQYEAQKAELEREHNLQQAKLLAAQQQAAVSAQQQEQLRAAEEQRQQGERWQSFLGGYNLSNVDDDSYAGEQSQAADYRSFLEGQLGTAGYDAGSLLGGYDPTEAINAARRTTEGFEAYKNTLQPWADQYGASQDLITNALNEQKTAGQQLSQYDQQVRDTLSGLGQAYQAYSDLGNIQSATGDTGKEKVMSLFGLQRPDIQGVQQEFAGIGSEVQRLANETSMLYGGRGVPTGQKSELLNQWQSISDQFNPAAQGLLSKFGSAQDTLYNMYGNLQDVMTGRIRSEASRQAGLLSQGANELASITGQASQLQTRAQDTYNQTASRLRATRIAEGQQLREQRAQQDFRNRQNRLMGLAATTLQKPMERTWSTLGRVQPDNYQYSQDPLGLSRGYSSLLGG